jgi:branched-chain amino acid transport system substrate-binding protein
MVLSKEDRMTKISRRTLLGALAAAPVMSPAIIRAQSVSAPITIGFLSDMSGLYRENGGPNNRAAAELAIADFGGSVLGRPVQIIQADDQNKPEVASALAREWIAEGKVSLLADGGSSAAALAIQGIAREKKCVYVITGPIANSLIGKQCSPYGFQCGGNAYSITKAATTALTRKGKDSWFTIVVDNDGGYTLEHDMHEFAKAAGGKVAGAVRAPLSTTDYSSFLIQAKASGAKVIGLGLAGQDVTNCVKQANEFGLMKDQVISAPLMSAPDVYAVGQDICKGLVLSSFFYWFLNPETTAFSKRFIAKMNKPPIQNHASSYVAVNHWLKAVAAANSLDGTMVAAKMRELPVKDFISDNLKIYPNGCVPHSSYLFEVKAASESQERFDLCNVTGSLSSADSNPSPGMYGCELT